MNFDAEDDEFIFSPSSKLASIFGLDRCSGEANTSLTYKAPKQPKPVSNSNEEKESEKVVEESEKVVEPDLRPDLYELAENVFRDLTRSNLDLATAQPMDLWRHENGQNTSLGKHMAAILRNPSNDTHELFVYRDKTKILIREFLNPAFTIYKYPNNFLAFYDNKKQFWNMNFNSADRKEDFLEYIVQSNCSIVDQGDKRANNTKAPTEKERILSKITKMGQPILPMRKLKSSSDLSDSETESSFSDVKPTKPVANPRKYKRNSSINQEKSLAPILHESNVNNNSIHHHQMMFNNPHASSLVYSQAIPDPYGLSNFILTQNAELKANLAEINLKLNHVMSNDKNGNSEDLNSLASKVKCQNLKIDNLTDELGKCRRSLEELRVKYKEKCDEVAAAGSEKDSQLVELTERVRKLQQVELEYEQLRDHVKQLDGQLNCGEAELANLKHKNDAQEEVKRAITEENAKITLLLEEANLKIAELERKSQEKEPSGMDKNVISNIVKESMNEAFRNIMDNFDENQNYSAEEIRKALSGNLKNISYRLMNSLL